MSALLCSFVSASIGVFGLLTTPGYNPSFDFGLSILLLGLHPWGPNVGKT